MVSSSLSLPTEGGQHVKSVLTQGPCDKVDSWTSRVPHLVPQPRLAVLCCVLCVQVLDISANLAEMLPGCVLQLTRLQELHAGVCRHPKNCRTTHVQQADVCNVGLTLRRPCCLLLLCRHEPSWHAGPQLCPHGRAGDACAGQQQAAGPAHQRVGSHHAQAAGPGTQQPQRPASRDKQPDRTDGKSRRQLDLFKGFTHALWQRRADSFGTNKFSTLSAPAAGDICMRSLFLLLLPPAVPECVPQLPHSPAGWFGVPDAPG